MVPTSPAPMLSLLGVASDPGKLIGTTSSTTAGNPAAAQAASGFQLLIAGLVAQPTGSQQPSATLLNPTTPLPTELLPATADTGKSLPPGGAALPLPQQGAAAELPIPDQLIALPVDVQEGAMQDDGDIELRADDEDEDEDGIELLFNPLGQTATPGMAKAVDAALRQTADKTGDTALATVAMNGNGGNPTAAAAGKQSSKQNNAAIAAAAHHPAAAAEIDTADKMVLPVAAATEADAAAGDAEFANVLKQLDSAAAGPTPTATGAEHSREAATRHYQSAAGATATVPVPVGRNGWSEAVVDKVMWFAAQQINSAEIHLNPPELGPLQVRISAQQDQASVFFTSQHAAVRDALNQALPNLRDMMDSQGIQLLDVGVGGHGAAQQQAQRQNGEGSAVPGMAGNTGEGGDESAATVERATVTRVPVGLVDAYV